MDGTSNNKVVGVSITGAAIFQGVSELQYDALFPKSYGSMTSPESIEVDMCLGSSEYNSVYHYYSYSPCMHDPTAAANAAYCQDLNSCSSNPISYATKGLTGPTIVGIAKDGHLIVGPFKDTNKLW
jgi:hypothetical protein